MKQLWPIIEMVRSKSPILGPLTALLVLVIVANLAGVDLSSVIQLCKEAAICE